VRVRACASAPSSAAQTIAAADVAFKAARHTEAVQLFTQALGAARRGRACSRAAADTSQPRSRRQTSAAPRSTTAPAPSPPSRASRRRAQTCAPRACRAAASAAASRLRSVNDERLKYSVAASDPDLAALRAWRGFPELAAGLAGAGGDGARPGAATARLRAEAKSPFRLLRLFAAGALGVGATIATLFTLPALLAAAARLGGGDEAARDALSASAVNAAVNGAVLAASLWAARAELAAKAAAEAEAGREEALSALRVVPPAGGASLPLAQLRGALRPLLLVGGRAHLRGAARAAEPLRRELVRRGLLLCVLAEGGEEGGAARARGFGAPPAAEAADAAGAGDEFAPNAPGSDWRCALSDVPAWRAWAAAQRAQMGIGEAEPFFVALDAEGCVARAQAGAPNWCGGGGAAAHARSRAHALARAGRLLWTRARC